MPKTTIASAAAAAFACLGLLAAAAAQTPSVAPGSPVPQPIAPGYSAPFPPPPPVPAEPKPADAVPKADAELALFGWLEGCWRGEVNERDFREHWLPLRGGLMVGAGHTVSSGKTQEYEYLRLEARADGVYYVNVAMSPAIRETSYKLVDRTLDKDDEIFTFANPAQEFPQKISYRRNSAGWLYATVEGKVNGVARLVIYPMHRINCETGEGIRK